MARMHEKSLKQLASLYRLLGYALRYDNDSEPDNLPVCVSRKTLVEFQKNGSLDSFPNWLTNSDEHRSDNRGEYILPLLPAGYSEPLADDKVKTVAPTTDNLVGAVSENREMLLATTATGVDETRIDADTNFVPTVSKEYVSWGNSADLKIVIKTRQFFPVFVTGLSGNGKTFSIEQECAKLGREMFRVNITRLTDEDDLLGGFRLVDGDTVWFDGPVVEAMQRGAVLLLDEVDLGTDKIMCLQSVLEGKGVFIKKINRWVKPADGFNVIATGNTKGQGDDTDKFAGTNVMNEAFLDRFPMWLEQNYPKSDIETKIVKNHGLSFDLTIESIDEIISPLIKFAKQTRKTYEDGGCDSVITTRRLCLITQLYSIYKDEKKNSSITDAVRRGCLRFDIETQEAFLKIFQALNKPKPEPGTKTPTGEDSEWGDIDQTAF